MAPGGGIGSVGRQGGCTRVPAVPASPRVHTTIVVEVTGQGHAPGATSAASVTPLRPASTTMVVRDGDHPGTKLEVLMLRRNVRSEFVGGVHVFPGGALDPDDSAAAAICEGLDDAGASEVLRLAHGGLAFWVAAVRECFEEAGLLYARTRRAGPLVGFGDAAVAERFMTHRLELNAHRRSFLEVCAAEGLVLALDRLHYFAHWITPRGAPRRYDTRFFVAAAPEDQTPAHDAGETVSDVWIRPSDALAAHRSGAMELILPTIRNLQAIERFATVRELLDAASRLADVPAIEPRMVMGTAGMTLLLPGDPGYDEAGEGDGGAADAAFGEAARLASRQANEP